MRSRAAAIFNRRASPDRPDSANVLGGAETTPGPRGGERAIAGSNASIAH
jgi:hypothetical protein